MTPLRGQVMYPVWPHVTVWGTPQYLASCHWLWHLNKISTVNPLSYLMVPPVISIVIPLSSQMDPPVVSHMILLSCPVVTPVVSPMIPLSCKVVTPVVSSVLPLSSQVVPPMLHPGHCLYKLSSSECVCVCHGGAFCQKPTLSIIQSHTDLNQPTSSVSQFFTKYVLFPATWVILLSKCLLWLDRWLCFQLIWQEANLL